MKDYELNSQNQFRVWIRNFVFISLLIIIGAVLYYYLEATRIRNEKYSDIAAISEMKAGEIIQWQKERFADVSRAANGPTVIKDLLLLEKNSNDTVAKDELRKILEVNKKGKLYENVFLISTQGKLILAAKDEPDLTDEKTINTVNIAFASKDAIFSDLFTHEKNVFYDVGAVSRSADRKPLAVMILRGNASNNIFPLMQSWPTRSKTAETLIFKRTGNEVVIINELRHNNNTAFNMRIPLSDINNPLIQTISGTQGKYEGIDYRGIKVMADLRPIEGLPWFMMTKVDGSEILAEVKYRGWGIAMLAILLILLTAMTMGFTFRQKQLDIYQSVYQSDLEKRLAEEMYRTTLYSIGDAVITTDKDGLIKQMNRIAETLTGWSEYEATGKPLEEIFNIINEDTYKKVENPAQRVFREGTIVGLANHTLLINKNGIKYPIADSAAPIYDDSGLNITGVVMVFRDQTKEREAQKELRESEERFRMMVDGVVDYAIIMLDTSGKIINWNNGAERLKGYTADEIIGQHFSVFYTYEDKANCLPDYE